MTGANPSGPRTERISDLLNGTETAFVSARYGRNRLLLIFPGDQRAIGELCTMVEPSGRDGCIGYAAFTSIVDQGDSLLAVRVQEIDDDLVAMSNAAYDSTGLRVLHQALLDLIDAVDPGGELFPLSQRVPISALQNRGDSVA